MRKVPGTAPLLGSGRMATDDERRVTEREFPRRTIARVDFDGELHDFQILDESDGGLGIYASSRDRFFSNSVVLVTVEADESRHATVRYISAHPNGGFQIGLKWV